MERDDEVDLLRTIMLQWKIDAYKGLYATLLSFSMSNFEHGFLEIYWPLLMILSMVPLVTEVFIHLKSGSSFKTVKQIISALVMSILVALCFYSTPEKWILHGITWEGLSIEDNNVMEDSIEASMFHWQESEKELLDLVKIPNTRIE